MMKVDENVVFVGGKHIFAYTGAAFTLFAQGYNEIELKARGKNIYNAIRAALTIKKKLGNVKIDRVEIEEEEFQNNGKKITVPAITIKLVRT